VQFVVDEERAGGPVKLDERGRARWEIKRLEAGRHRISALFQPAPGGADLPSASALEVHTVECPPTKR
ncbi:MAG: Ig-like domain-containing protein, partial [Myxococcota bacterium]